MTVIAFEPHRTAREEQDRVERAEIAAGWFFNEATKTAKAEFDAALQVALGMRGQKWDIARRAARDKFRDDTAEARALFDETVECFLAHGEISEELDQKWTSLCALEAVRAALNEAAE